MVESLSSGSTPKKPTVFCSVAFEFDDPRFMEYQQKQREAASLLVQLIRRPNPMAYSTSLTMSHRNEEDRLVGMVEISFFGNRPQLNEQSALEKATFNVLGWLRDGGLNDISFIYTSLKIGILGVDSYAGTETRDMTVEAHALEASLTTLDSTLPEDLL
jgi:hypothetical protein